MTMVTLVMTMVISEVVMTIMVISEVVMTMVMNRQAIEKVAQQQ
jgi:hypothetical protein